MHDIECFVTTNEIKTQKLFLLVNNNVLPLYNIANILHAR